MCVRPTATWLELVACFTLQLKFADAAVSLCAECAAHGAHVQKKNLRASSESLVAFTRVAITY
jgi:hypothetical protein